MRAFILIAILSISAPALANPGPTWTVRGFSTERWLGRSSAVTLSEAPMNGGGVALERRLLTLALPGPFHTLDLSGDVDFDDQSTDGTTFQGQLDNHISSWELTAGGRARLRLVSGLHLEARVGLGGARTHVRIADAYRMTTAIEDGGNATVLSTGLGFAFLPRLTRSDRHAVHLGVEIELGYQQTTATAISATPQDRPPPELTIPAQYASLGSIDLDGWSLRLGATLGF